MNPPAGWYVDPQDPSREVYWNGAAWLFSQVRPRTPGASDVPHGPRATPDDIDDDYQAAMLQNAAEQTAHLRQIRFYVGFLALVMAVSLGLAIIGYVVAVATH